MPNFITKQVLPSAVVLLKVGLQMVDTQLGLACQEQSVSKLIRVVHVTSGMVAPWWEQWRGFEL